MTARAGLFLLTVACILTMLRSLQVSRPILRMRGGSTVAMSSSNFQNGLAAYTLSDRLGDLAVVGSSSMAFKGDVLFVPFYKPAVPDKDKSDDKALAAALRELIPVDLSPELKSMIGEIIDEGVFKADVMTKQVSRVFSTTSPVKHIALVGLGPNPKKDVAGGDIEVASAARLGRSVATITKEIKAASAGVAMPSGIANAGITQFLLGVSDAAYNDNRYRKVPEGGFKPHTLSSISILGCSEAIAKDVPVTAKLTDMIASGVDFAKDLVGAPPNSKTPVVIADLARKMAKEHNLEVKVLGQAECEALGMGAYLGVQQGSKYPPQFIHLTYKSEASSSATTSKVALVGKGLTFDSGGYNIKAGAGSMIELMKFDMGGCAAVLGAAKAIGQLRPKNLEVHFITAVCENMISRDAMKPGDVLVASNKKTIEVLNTDAEGRLTLADALVYAERQGADTIVDLATLTGACIVALGEKMAGLYSPDDKLRGDLEAAAKRADEGIWPMPLEPSYKELIKSQLADLKNIGAKGGGSITAALFLQEFVDKSKWAHIDMAGPVWDTSNTKPTGYGVKLLVDFLLNIKK